MQKDLPLGVVGNGGDDFNDRGSIFGPTQPATECGYTVDADTDAREVGPDQFLVQDPRCGRSDNFPAISGKCPANQTPQEYADAYFFKPINTDINFCGCAECLGTGGWLPNVGVCYDEGDPKVTLDKQKELFLKLATDATAQAQWNDPVLSAKKPTFYNEFVFKDTAADLEKQIAAIVWAHTGPFFNDIRDCPNNGGAYTCELCEIQREFCKGGKRPDKPLIEIANLQYVGVGGCTSNDPSYDLITSYKDVVDKGGYDADTIFRELSWDEVCGPGKDFKSGFRPPFRALCKRNGQ